MDETKKYVCRCEEVTEEEIREAIKNGATSLNEIKRWTRAGMGLCQGKICSKNVTRILSQETGQAPGSLEPSTFRKPVRPIRIEALSKKEGGNE